MGRGPGVDKGETWLYGGSPDLRALIRLLMSASLTVTVAFGGNIGVVGSGDLAAIGLGIRG